MQNIIDHENFLVNISHLWAKRLRISLLVNYSEQHQFRQYYQTNLQLS